MIISNGSKAQQLNGLQAERRQIVVNDVEHHATTPVESDAHLARCHHRLFKQALAVRSAWLRVHRLPVQDALEACLDMAENRRSIRRLLEQDAQTGRWLRQIFRPLAQHFCPSVMFCPQGKTSQNGLSSMKAVNVTWLMRYQPSSARNIFSSLAMFTSSNPSYS